jgi:hypothetical protein
MIEKIDLQTLNDELNKINELIEEINEIKKLIEPTS